MPVLVSKVERRGGQLRASRTLIVAPRVAEEREVPKLETGCIVATIQGSRAG